VPKTVTLQGNYVRDDARKYPSKDSMSGGFAGGERGVRKFAATGDLSFEDEWRPQVCNHSLAAHGWIAESSLVSMQQRAVRQPW
jgi:hypothetical protein